MTRAKELDYIITLAQKGVTGPNLLVMAGHPGLQATMRLVRGLKLINGSLIKRSVQLSIRGFLSGAKKLCIQPKQESENDPELQVKYTFLAAYYNSKFEIGSFPA